MKLNFKEFKSKNILAIRKVITKITLFFQVFCVRLRILLPLRVDRNGETSFARLQTKRARQSQNFSQNATGMRQVDAFSCQQSEKRQLEYSKIFGDRTFRRLHVLHRFTAGLRFCYGLETFAQIASFYDASWR